MKEIKYTKMFSTHNFNSKNLSRKEVVKYSIGFIVFILMTGFNF